MLQSRESDLAALALRVALAASFLSAVADRFGLWGEFGSGEVAWGSYPAFVSYTQTLLWFLSASTANFLALCATALEIVLAAALMLGHKIRFVGYASSLLLFSFALSMTFSTGAEGPLSYSVWTAAAAVWLLATLPSNKQHER